MSETNRVPDVTSNVATAFDSDRWEFRQANGQWRWTHYAGNNRIVGASTEGFNNKADCVSNAERNGFEDVTPAPRPSPAPAPPAPPAPPSPTPSTPPLSPAPTA